MQKVVFYLTVIFLFTFCSKDKNEEIYPSYKGKLIGYVKLIEDHYMELPITNYKNVAVKIWSGNKCISKTLTDSTGYFEINNLLTGIYKITFEKDSFNTTTIYQYNFYGNGAEIFSSYTNPQYVIKKPTTKFLYFNFTPSYDYENNFEITTGFKFIKNKFISSDSYSILYPVVLIRFFYGRDSTISCNNYENTYLLSVSSKDNDLNQPFTGYFYKSGNYKKGTKIFVKAYIDNGWTTLNSLDINICNYNPITGKNEYYGINPDEFKTTSFIY